MKREDARTLSQDAQEALRKRAVAMVVAERQTCTHTARLLGVARGTVSKWVNAYKRQGTDSLNKRKRGRRSQDMKRLSPHQCTTIVRLIKDKFPDQLKLPFMLWTRQAVQELIHNRYNILLEISTVGLYLKRWGFTPQKPIRRAYERQDSLVKKWLCETYPSIASKAKAEGAEIHWGDEAGFRSDHQAGTSYGLKGKTPLIRCPGKRFKTNMISTVTNKGTLRFMIFDGSFTTSVFIAFLKRLIKGQKRKVFLILDNMRVHHAKVVKAWVEEHKNQIELFFLPAYSPEMNPDELLNQDVKTNAVGRKRSKNLDELKKNLRDYLFGTQRRPDIVRAYFRKKEVAYAA